MSTLTVAALGATVVVAVALVLVVGRGRSGAPTVPSPPSTTGPGPGPHPLTARSHLRPSSPALVVRPELVLALAPGPAVRVVRSSDGRAGLGTSELALRCAHERARVGDGVVWWVDAHDDVALHLGLVELAEALGIAAAAALDETVATIVRVLDARAAGWFVVLDGVPDAARVAALVGEPTGGTVLITTCDPHRDPSAPWDEVVVGPLDGDQSATLLLRATGADDRGAEPAAEPAAEPTAEPVATPLAGPEAAHVAEGSPRPPATESDAVRSVAAWCGGVPLALAVAAAVAVADHDRDLNRLALALSPVDPHDPTGAATPFERLWALARGALGPVTIEVLGRVALLPDRPVPLEVLGIDGDADGSAVDPAGLRRLVLVDGDGQGRTSVEVPGPLAAAIGDPHDPTAARRAEELAVALGRVTDDLDPQDPGDAAAWRRLTPVALGLLALPQPPVQIVGPATAVGLALVHQGLRAEAAAVLEPAHALASKVLGDDDPTTLELRHLRASTFLRPDGTDDEGAVDRWTEMVADCERVLGPDHATTLDSRHNLGVALHRRGHDDAAAHVLAAVLADSSRVHGTHHRDTLLARISLADALTALKRTDEAARELQIAAAEATRLHGTDSEISRVARLRLSRAHLTAQQPDRAVRLLTDLVEEASGLLGPLHLRTLDLRHSLAQARRADGDADRAVAELIDLRGEMDLVVGPNSPIALDVRHTLAHALDSAGRTDEAIALTREVLEASERTLGPEHRRTVTTRHNLAAFLRSTGRAAEAIPLLESVVRSRTSAHGPDHPTALVARTSLASAHWADGDLDRARQLFHAVLPDLVSVLGAEHPDTLWALSNLATCEHSAGRTAEAIALEQRVLAGRERALGPDHERTRATRTRLARWTGADRRHS